MIRIPLAELVEKIKEKTGLSEEDIKKKVDAKLSQLSGLVSPEGAAHIVATELGVKLLEPNGKIKDLYPTMRNVTLKGKVVQIFDAKEFSRADGSLGKLRSFVVGDETGSVRVVSWNEQADLCSSMMAGMTVRITNTQVRENRGFREVHLTSDSQVSLNPSDVIIGEVKSRESVKKEINKLVETDENVEIKGTVLEVFDIRFFEVCGSCGSRVRLEGEKWNCQTHREVTPDYSYVLNVFLDDGSGSIRVVLFRNQAEKLLKKSKQEILVYRENPALFEEMKTMLLGEQFKFVGRVKKNPVAGRSEFVVSLVFPVSEELAKV